MIKNLQEFLVCGSLDKFDISQQGTKEPAMIFVSNKNQANIGDI